MTLLGVEESSLQKPAVDEATLVALNPAAGATVPAMLPRQGIDDVTLLVKLGMPRAVIIFPFGEEAYRSVVEQLQNTIEKRTGVRIPARTDREILVDGCFINATMKQQNLILLGNLSTNRALVQLAANSCVHATCKWPGKDGYELRTVTNPFGTKKNCILIGGSDVATVRRATQRFFEELKVDGTPVNLRVPRLLDVVVDGIPQRQLESKPLPDRGPFNGTYRLAEVVYAYHRSGSEARGQVVRQALEEYLDLEMAPAASDYGTESAIRALDLVDTCLLDDEENHRMDNLVLQWVLQVKADKPYWNPQGRTWSFGGHQACGALSFYAAVNYLLKNGQPNAEARSILEDELVKTRTYLQYLSTSFKDHRKDVGWETWTPLSVPLRYALTEGDMTFFTAGTLLDVVRRHFYAEQSFGPAGMAAFILGDGRYKSLAPEGEGLGGWAYVLGGPTWVTSDSLRPLSPDFLLGTQVMRASPTDWEHARATPPGPSAWYTPLPHNKTFHLIGFADGVSSSDMLAVVGGWDSHSTPGEANSIRMFRQGGHHYLFRADGNDQRQPRPGRFYQNSLMVESAHYDVSPPCAAELLVHHDQKDLGFMVSRLEDFHGVTWDRGVFWRPEQYFVVFDRCRVQEPGPITLVNQWWNRDIPGIEGDRWIARTPRSTFHLVMSDPGVVSSKNWWDGGPHQLRQEKYFQAKRGQPVGFCNLFYVDEEESHRYYETRPLGANALLVRGWHEQQGARVEDIAIVGHSALKSDSTYGRLRIQAPWFFIAPDLVILKNQEQRDGNQNSELGMSIDGQAVDAERPCLGQVLRELWDVAGSELVSEDPTSEKKVTDPKSFRFQRVTKRETGIRTGFRPLTGTSVSQDSAGMLTWDLQQSRSVRSIEGIRTAQEQVEVHFAEEDPAGPWQVANVSVGQRLHWVYYQYGMAASLGIQTFSPVEIDARYFRIPLPAKDTSYGRWIHGHWHNQAWNVTGHNPQLFNRPFWQDVKFLSDQPEVGFTHSLVSDLDGDQQEEWIVSTDQFELFMIDATGQLRWKRTFEAPVLDFLCEDLDGDGQRDVICSTQATKLHVLDQHGNDCQTTDMLADHISGPNALSFYVDGTQERGLFVATYHATQKYDQQGVQLHAESAPGFYIDAMPSVVTDVTGDGLSDPWMRENVRGQVALLDGKTLLPLASCATGQTGRGKALIRWKQETSTAPARVLSVAESGISMVETVQEPAKTAGGDSALVLGGLQTVFSFPISPIIAWEIVDFSGDHREEIILATRNGGIVVLTGEGQWINATVVAAEIFDCTVWGKTSGSPQILVATDRGILSLDNSLSLIGQAVPDTQDCRLIQCLNMGNIEQAVCLFVDGRVAVFPNLKGAVSGK